MDTLVDLSVLSPRLARLERPAEPGLTPGLSRALATRLGVDPLVIRAGFAALTAISGLGIALYAWGTLVTPVPSQRPPILRAVPGYARWPMWGQIAAMIVVTGLATLIIGPVTGLGWPLVVGAVLVAAILRKQPSRPAVPQALPTLNLYSPAKMADVEEPRAPASWIGALLLAAAGGVGAVAGLLTWPAQAALAASTAALAGMSLTALSWGIFRRSRRLPMPILVLIPALALLVAGLVGSPSTSGPTPTGQEIQAPQHQAGQHYELLGQARTIILNAEPQAAPRQVTVRTVASEVRIVVPTQAVSVATTQRLSELSLDFEPVAASESQIHLVIDSTLSSVQVEVAE